MKTETSQNKIFNALKAELGYTNPMQTPRVEKVVVSSGVGKIKDQKRRDFIAERLARITGQRAAPRGAKKAVANFKSRVGDVVGFQVTLRGKYGESFYSGAACAHHGPARGTPWCQKSSSEFQKPRGRCCRFPGNTAWEVRRIVFAKAYPYCTPTRKGFSWHQAGLHRRNGEYHHWSERAHGVSGNLGRGLKGCFWPRRNHRHNGKK